MGDVNHVQNLLVDYALGLLPYPKRKEVERHAAVCVDCRLALQREQQIGRAVKETVQAATRPAAGRLEQLMPAVPTRRTGLIFGQAWQRQVAALCVTLILLVSSAGLYTMSYRPLQQPSRRYSTPSFDVPSSIATTATVTNEPIATLAQTAATAEMNRTNADGNAQATDGTMPGASASPTMTTIAATPSPKTTAAVRSPTPTLTYFEEAIP